MPILKTFCSICNPHSHCGINARVEHGELVSVEGMPEHPANQGTLCSKGAASRQYVYAKNRLKYPMIQRGERGSKNWERISWEEAFSVIASRLTESAINTVQSPQSSLQGIQSGTVRFFSVLPLVLAPPTSAASRAPVIPHPPWLQRSLTVTSARLIFLGPVVFSRGPQTHFIRMRPWRDISSITKRKG